MNHCIYNIAVGSDGTVFTDVVWDEGGYECTQWNPDGTLNRSADYTHGWGNNGGMAVACAANYVYLGEEITSVSGYTNANTWPAANLHWFGISRRQRSNIQLGASFTGGMGSAAYSGVVPVGSFLLVNQVSNSVTAAVTGLAASATRLYAADPYNGLIRVYDATSMASLATWSVPRVFRLTIDSAGNVWAIQRAGEGQPPLILEFNTNGTPEAAEISFAAGVDPVAIAYDGTNRLLVADDGPDQNIKFYSLPSLTGTPTTIASTLGSSLMGGTGTNIGRIGPARFYGLTGVGMDTNGNVYVSWNFDGPPDGVTNKESWTHSQGVLEKFSASGQPLWSRYGLLWVDMSSMDPASESDFYSAYGHYQLNWSNSVPGSEWSFTGVTYDRFLYPLDPRPFPVGCDTPQSCVRHLNGRSYLFCSGQLAQYIAAFRFDPTNHGEVAVPAFYISKGVNHALVPGALPGGPAAGEYMWRDLNGDGRFETNEFTQPASASDLGDATWGWWVDDGGEIWMTVNRGTPTTPGLRRFRLQGFDTNRVPIYSYSQMDLYPVPVPFLDQYDNGLERVIYDRTNDLMYLGGYTSQYPSGTWGGFRVLARYDNWSTGNRTATWILPLPYNLGTANVPICMAAAGAFIFVVSVTGQSDVSVYRASDGAHVGELTPNNGLFTLANTGYVDERPFGLFAYQRANGEYLVVVEEDGNLKNVVYRWNPNWPAAPSLGTISVASGRLTMNINGDAGANYRLQVSTNLASGWTTLWTSNWTSLPAQIVDNPGTGASRRFYRAVVVP